jgi:hypothetical protein
MSDMNTAAPLPETNSGATNPNPDLTVVPDAGPLGERALINTRLAEQLVLAAEVCAAAQNPVYAPRLADKGIEATFVSALAEEILAAGEQARLAVQSSNARKGATAAEAAAAEALIASLRDLQQAARTQHLPDHPEKLGDYYVGRDLGRSRPLLTTYAEHIANTANQERPPGVDTTVITRVAAQRQAFVEAAAKQADESGKGQQARAQFKEMLASITARRKKIQYAADRAFPPRDAAQVEARAAFKLPLNRRYSG